MGLPTEYTEKPDERVSTWAELYDDLLRETGQKKLEETPSEKAPPPGLFQFAKEAVGSIPLLPGYRLRDLLSRRKEEPVQAPVEAPYRKETFAELYNALLRETSTAPPSEPPAPTVEPPVPQRFQRPEDLPRTELRLGPQWEPETPPSEEAAWPPIWRRSAAPPATYISPEEEALMPTVEKIGRSFTAGLAATIGDPLSYGLDILGADDAAKTVREATQEIRRYTTLPSALKEFEWKDLGDVNFYISKGVATVPALLALFPVGIGGAALGTGLATAFGLHKLAKVGLALAAGSGLSRTLEGGMEAASTYESLLAQGIEKEKAAWAATEVWKKNFTLVGMDAVQLAAAIPGYFGIKVPGPLARGLAKYVTMIAAKAGAASLEGLEEVWQGLIQQSATEYAQGKRSSVGIDFSEMMKDIRDWPAQRQEEFILGTLMGLGFQGAATLKDYKQAQLDKRGREYVREALESAAKQAAGAPLELRPVPQLPAGPPTLGTLQVRQQQIIQDLLQVEQIALQQRRKKLSADLDSLVQEIGQAKAVPEEEQAKITDLEERRTGIERQLADLEVLGAPPTPVTKALRKELASVESQMRRVQAPETLAEREVRRDAIENELNRIDLLGMSPWALPEQLAGQEQVQEIARRKARALAPLGAPPIPALEEKITEHEVELTRLEEAGIAPEGIVKNLWRYAAKNKLGPDGYAARLRVAVERFQKEEGAKPPAVTPPPAPPVTPPPPVAAPPPAPLIPLLEAPPVETAEERKRREARERLKKKFPAKPPEAPPAAPIIPVGPEAKPVPPEAPPPKPEERPPVPPEAPPVAKPLEQPKPPVEKAPPTEALPVPSTKVFDWPIDEVDTEISLFQNRVLPYSIKTVMAIVEGYDPNRMDPIVVYRMEGRKNPVVLSGHSRLEGMRRRGDQKTISLRFFEGTLDQATEYARLHANRGADAEDLIESIKAYKFAVESGKTDQQLKQTFRQDTDFLRDIQDLDPAGDFIKIMNQPAFNEFPYIRRIARWTGQLRKTHAGKLTNRHEQQVFDFFYKAPESKANREITKDNFFELIDRQVTRHDFNPDQPLIFRRGEVPTTGTRARADTKELEERLDELRKQRDEARTVEERQAIQKEIDQTTKNLQEIVKTQSDLFAEEEKPAPKVEPVKPPELPVTGEEVAPQLDPETVSDLTEVAREFYKPGMAKEEVAKRLTEEFGADIAPYTDAVYKQIARAEEKPIPKKEAEREREEPAQRPEPPGRPAGKPELGRAPGPGVGRAPEGLPKLVVARPEHTKEVEIRKTPERFGRFLTPEQLQGSEKAIIAIDKGEAFLLGGGTGTGKTWALLAVAANYAEKNKPVVIVTKGEAIKPNWKTAAFAGTMKEAGDILGVPLILVNSTSMPTALAPGKVYLTTYENIKAVSSRVTSNTVLILDEAHALKNAESTRSSYGMVAIRKAEGVLFSTATSSDKPLHIHYLERIGITEGGTVADMLQHLGMKLVKIKTKLRVIDKWVHDLSLPAGVTTQRLNDLFARMTAKNKVLKYELSLEGVKIEINRIELPPEAHAIQAKIERELYDGPVGGLQLANLRMHQRRQQEPYKIPAAVKMAREELAKGRQVVLYVSRVNYSEVAKKIRTGSGTEDYIREVVTQSEGTAKLLREELRKAGITDIVELHGESDTKAPEAMKKFQDGKGRIMIATIESGGTGINLDDMAGDKPRTMIIITAPFSGVDNVQAIGRVWRLNTMSYPVIRYLFADTEIDDLNAAILANKMRTLRATVSGQVKRLDISEMEETEFLYEVPSTFRTGLITSEAARETPTEAAKTKKAKAAGAELTRTLSQKGRYSLLANAITTEIKDTGVTNFIGKKATTSDDIAVLGQAVRDGRWEVLRYVFVRQGRIIDVVPISARLPGATGNFPLGVAKPQPLPALVFRREGTDDVAGPIRMSYEKARFVVQYEGRRLGTVLGRDEAVKLAQAAWNTAHSGWIKWLKSEVEKRGADGLYMLHNHNTGGMNPSTADLDSAVQVAIGIKEFRSSVVIDSGEYAVVTIEPTNMRVGTIRTIKKNFGPEKIRVPSAAHPVLFEEIETYEDVAEIGRSIQKPENWSLLIGGSSENEVLGLMIVANPLLLHFGRSRALIRRFARNTGSYYVSLVADHKLTDSDPDQFVRLQREGFLRYVLDDRGKPSLEIAETELPSRERFGKIAWAESQVYTGEGFKDRLQRLVVTGEAVESAATPERESTLKNAVKGEDDAVLHVIANSPLVSDRLREEAKTELKRRDLVGREAEKKAEEEKQRIQKDTKAEATEIAKSPVIESELPQELRDLRPSDPLLADGPVAMGPTARESYVLNAVSTRPADEAPLPAYRVLDAFAKVIKVLGREIPIRFGNMAPGYKWAAGYFQVIPEVIRSRVANDLPNGAHEIGHALEKVLFGWPIGGTWKTPFIPKEALAELEAMGHALYGSRVPNAGYRREGFAEYMAFYVLTEDGAAKQAPKFHDWFQTTVLARTPELAGALANAKALARQFADQGAIKFALASVVTKERMRQFLIKLRHLPTTVLRRQVESAYPLERVSQAAEAILGRPLKPEEDPYKIITGLRLVHIGRVRFMIRHGMVDMTGYNITGPALEDATSLVQGRRQEFTIYLWARRALELWHRRINPGLPKEFAEYIVRFYEQDSTTKATFQRAAQMVYQWNKGILTYMAQARLITPDVYQRILSENRYYVPLRRVFDELDEIFGVRTGAVSNVFGKNPLQFIKGSGRRIRDPFVVMVEQAERYVRASHHKLVLDALLKLRNIGGLEKAGMGRLIEEIPRKVAPLNIQLERILQELKKRDIEYELPEDFDIDQYITFFMPAYRPTGPKPQVAIYENGQIKWFELEGDLYRTLTTLDPYRFPGVWDWIIGKPVRAFRLGTTGLRAAFSLITNPARDLTTFLCQAKGSRDPSVLAKAYLQSARDAIRHYATGRGAPYFEAFTRLGGPMGQPLGPDTAATRQLVRELFQRNKIKIWFHPIEHLRDIFQLPESIPRVAELRLTAKKVGWTPGQQMTFGQSIEMLYAAKRVTVDFSASGDWGRVANQVVPFWNPNVQGLRSFARAFKDNPALAVARGLTVITPITLLMWVLNRDEDWWKDLPWRQKYTFWWIPVRIQGEKHVIRIPRPFEWGMIFGSLIEGAADAWYRDDPKSAAAAIQEAVQILNPGIAVETEKTGGIPFPYPENPLAVLIAEQMMNKRKFTGTPIEPRGAEQLPRAERMGPYTSGVAKFIGGLVNVSPMRLDHAFRTIFGGAAGDLAEAYDFLQQSFAGKALEPSKWPVIGTSVRRGGREGAESQAVEEIFNAYDRARERARSIQNPETDIERDSRLLLDDATRAIGALIFMRNAAKELPTRQALSIRIREIALDIEEKIKGTVSRQALRQMEVVRRQVEREEEKLRPRKTRRRPLTGLSFPQLRF